MATLLDIPKPTMFGFIKTLMPSVDKQYLFTTFDDYFEHTGVQSSNLRTTNCALVNTKMHKTPVILSVKTLTLTMIEKAPSDDMPKIKTLYMYQALKELNVPYSELKKLENKMGNTATFKLTPYVANKTINFDFALPSVKLETT